MRPRKIYNVILELAQRVPRFTPRNLTPALTLEQSQRNCLELARLKLLTRVSKGKAGRGERVEAVYVVKVKR